MTNALDENVDELERDDDAEERTGKPGRKFVVCIEDRLYRWPRNTITTEEIAELGGWDPSIGVIEVDKDQNERTLEPGEVVKLKPGLAFGKKFCWKRG